MQITYINTAELKPYKNNPRKNDKAVDGVAASIREFGFKVPIIIGSNFEVVAGHTRLKAAAKLGLTKVPCIVADDLTPDQIKAYRLADNKTAELAEWELDLLNLELSELDLDMSAFGFDTQLTDGGASEDNFTPDPPDVPMCRIGDIYLLGQHRLLCGDACDLQAVITLTKGEAVDLLLTDPPYNVNYVGKTADALKIANDKMEDKRFAEFLSAAFHNAHEALKPGGAYYIFYAPNETEKIARVAREYIGKVRQCLIWNKNAIVLGHLDYHNKHEPCLYGWKEGAAHYFIDDRTQATVHEDKGVDLKKLKKDEAIALLAEIYSDKTSATVIAEDRPIRSAEHPTMKPIKLLARLVKNSTKIGETVLDLFGGSGSTLIACEQLNRRCYMMELDPRYCDVIIKRWEQFTGSKVIKMEENTRKEGEKDAERR